jgi:hypothetical protein
MKKNSEKNTKSTSDTLTDADCDGLGISPVLFRQGEHLMNGLWNFCLHYFAKDTPVSSDNTILLRDLILEANFVNNEYIEVRIHRAETDLIVLRYTDSIYTVLNCFKLVLFHELKFKK